MCLVKSTHCHTSPFFSNLVNVYRHHVAALSVRYDAAKGICFSTGIGLKVAYCSTLKIQVSIDSPVLPPNVGGFAGFNVAVGSCALRFRSCCSSAITYPNSWSCVQTCCAFVG